MEPLVSNSVDGEQMEETRRGCYAEFKHSAKDQTVMEMDIEHEGNQNKSVWFAPGVNTVGLDVRHAFRRTSMDVISHVSKGTGPTYSSILNVKRRPSRISSNPVMRTVHEEGEPKSEESSVKDEKPASNDDFDEGKIFDKCKFKIDKITGSHRINETNKDFRQDTHVNNLDKQGNKHVACTLKNFQDSESLLGINTGLESGETKGNLIKIF